MITWLNPAAWVGAIALIVPILIHLWRRHRADRVRFPSLRFVPAARLSALRAGTPSDLLLLLVRSLIILMAVAAVARPLVVTGARIDRWNQATARVLVVDASESMRGRDALVRVEAARTGDADWNARVDDASLDAGMRRAVSLLRTAPPARREIVVISDFQLGALAPDALDSVPAAIGIRLVAVGTSAPERTLAGATLLAPSGATAQEIRLAGPLTSVSTRTIDAPAGGLRLETAAADRAAGVDLLAAVARAGAPSADPAQPLTVVFEGGQRPGVGPLPAGWMWQTVARLMRDRDVIDAVGSATACAVSVRESGWVVLFRDSRGAALVQAGAAGSALVLDVCAPPQAYLSAAVVHGALTARVTPLAERAAEAEVERSSDSDLARWSRPAPPVSAEVWQSTSLSDARWCWAAALALMAIEAVLRRSKVAAVSGVQAHAA